MTVSGSSTRMNPRGSLPAAYAVLFLFLALCAVASFLPGARLWGINHLVFYPWPVRVAGLVVMAVSLLPGARRAVLRWMAVLSTVFAERRWVAAAVLSVGAFVLFTVFASSTQLLGDGLYIENNVERAAKVDSGTFAKVLKNPDRNYPGTEMLLLTVSRVAANAFDLPPLGVVRVINGLFGALLVFIITAGCCPPRVPHRVDPVPFVLLAFLSGAAQIFFGYVEAYAPLMFFAALFVLLADRTINRGAGLWGPVVCALAAVGMHMLGFLLLPALGILVLWVVCRREATRRFIRGALVLAVATIAAPPLVVLVGRLGRVVLPLTARDHSYTVFSVAHLVDVVNEILLLLPGFLVLGGALVLWGWRPADPKGKAGGVKTADHTKGDEIPASLPFVLFGLFLGVPALLFLLSFKPELGMARDWDLFAVTSVGFWALLYAVLAHTKMATTARGIGETVLPPVLVASAVLTAAWIGVNAHPGRSVARFESILSYDRTNAAYAYETLASHHHNRQDFPAEIRALERAVEASRNPRYLFTLGLRYYYVDQKQKAVSALETCLKVKPDHAQARQSLVQMLFFMERYDDLLAVCEEGVRLAPEDPYYPLFTGMAYVKKDRVFDARDAFDRCLRLNPAPDVVSEINKILQSISPRPGENPPEGRTPEETP